MPSTEVPLPDGLLLRPLRGVRYAVPELADVTSPPYDLISPDDLRNLLSLHPNNVVRLILPGADRHRYGEARETLRNWLATGVLTIDGLPALYVYEQNGNGHLQRGVIGNVGLADPGQGIILPHEETVPAVVADRLGLMRATEANLEPILLLYHGGGAATRLVGEVAESRLPLADVRTRDGIRHRLWAVTDPDEIDAVAADLRGRRALIADGHHRYATYRLLQRERREAGAGDGPWDYGLAMLVDSSAYPPQVRAIHRVVPGLTPEEAAARAKGACRVQDFTDLADALAALADASGPAFVLAGGGHAHLLTEPDPLQLEHAMPKDRSARWRSLDPAVLGEFLLPRVFGVPDDDPSVLVVHDDHAEAVRRADATGGTAVLLRPLSVDDVLAVAAQGELVPRKSTSFGPKPRTGLVLRTFFTD
ncbi:DUF1015 domain-containing protein [Thermopolyspora flexuosa]|jgi:uncharacterized protein (DUF1015 family)|uniref:Uncharacterized protein (DUF1015 family) n=1 Tax=Thermopolyspora flexuosa TaxID=103836 RepID=A0A543IXG8_9ACTN|nr:DUF1015 domain-containing protein [Thermopolyspora flexuosa]TQM75266.1 uncharacterized protein (DUF1015 family) [Thermopolyspora flexuosa]